MPDERCLPICRQTRRAPSDRAGECLLTDGVVEDVLGAQIVGKRVSGEHVLELRKRRRDHVVVDMRYQIGGLPDLFQRLLAVVVVAFEKRQHAFIENAKRDMLTRLLPETIGFEVYAVAEGSCSAAYLLGNYREKFAMLEEEIKRLAGLFGIPVQISKKLLGFPIALPRHQDHSNGFAGKVGVGLHGELDRFQPVLAIERHDLLAAIERQNPHSSVSAFD